MKNAKILNEEELENVNGGFIGILVLAFLGSCAVGTGLGFLAQHYADDSCDE